VLVWWWARRAALAELSAPTAASRSENVIEVGTNPDYEGP